MTEPVDRDLYHRTQALLEPGDVDLAGAIVHTDLGGDEDIAMQHATVEVGEVVAQRAGAGDDWYVYAGNDDPEFASNQFQGRRLADDGFVWECQQLLREGTFDLVFYYEAEVDQEALLSDLRTAGYEVTGVTVD